MNLQRPLNRFQHLALAILKKTIGMIWGTISRRSLFCDTFKALFTASFHCNYIDEREQEINKYSPFVIDWRNEGCLLMVSVYY